MFGIGGQELVLLMVIGLIVLGPEKLPRIANQVGGWLGQARRMTRVMKRQLEEELDINKPPTIKPPPSSREPSNKTETTSEDEPEYTLPSDDDEHSPAHGDDEAGTGVGDEIISAEEKVAASDAERDAVEEAALSPIEKKPETVDNEVVDIAPVDEEAETAEEAEKEKAAS